jgi:hypothetical protein
MKLGFGGKIRNVEELEFWKGWRVGELRKQSAIELSIKKFSKCRSEMKLGFGGRIRNTKELKLQKGWKARELTIQSAIKLSIKKFS